MTREYLESYSNSLTPTEEYNRPTIMNRYKVIFYMAHTGKRSEVWRWRFVYNHGKKNEKIMAVSSEGYRHLLACKKCFKRVNSVMPDYVVDRVS